jgi:hypothetical protein
MTRPSLQYFRRLAAKAPRGQFWLFFTAAGAAIVRFGYSAALLGIAALAAAATLLFARLSGAQAASTPDPSGYLENLTAVRS